MKRESLMKRMLAVTMLSYLHRFYTYRELSEKLSIPPSMISRYLRGHSLPSEQHTEVIMNFFMNDRHVKSHLNRLIARGSLSELLKDVELLEILAFIVLERIKYMRIVFDYVVVINDISSTIGLKVASRLGATVLVGFIPPLVPPTVDICITIGQYINSLTICFKVDNVAKLRRSSAVFIHPLTIPIEYVPYIRRKLVDIFSYVHVLAPICNEELERNSIICGFITSNTE
ncbi:hypothetical protein [Pyrodictium abyssi]|uniref:HTH cro/C1-type domain-containing protein n=1 Tax=Pyrodictium abyssi TaxID=54256 RepID=A0ABM8IUV2_9CREN|nr:hypothetical protein PABY_08980 [Pyrodictium abyssi]